MPQNGFGLKEKDKIITYTTVHTSPKSTNFSNYTFLFLSCGCLEKCLQKIIALYRFYVGAHVNLMGVLLQLYM